MTTEKEMTATSGVQCCMVEVLGNVALEVFRRLDKKSLCAASCVNRAWRDMSRKNELWAVFNNITIPRTNDLTEAVLDVLDGVDPRTLIGIAVADKIKSVRSSMIIAHDYTTRQTVRDPWRMCRNQFFVNAMFVAFNSHLEETLRGLKKLLTQRRTVTRNFDIFDLTTRRYIEELRTLIPAEHFLAAAIDPPGPNGDWVGIPDPRISHVIIDSDAAGAWCTAFGQSTFVAPFSCFYERVIWKAFPAEARNARFANHIRFHLNFPDDGMVSTWRFQSLVNTFGPWGCFAANFCKFALGGGFIGLVSAVDAQMLLAKRECDGSNDIVLTRFSRGQPGILAFTCYEAKTRKYYHSRNVNSTGRIVPIPEFMKMEFPDAELARFGIDEAMLKTTSITAYADEDIMYVHNQSPV